MTPRTPENRVAALLELGEINPDQAADVLREIREAVLEIGKDRDYWKARALGVEKLNELNKLNFSTR